MQYLQSVFYHIYGRTFGGKPIGGAIEINQGGKWKQVIDFIHPPGVYKVNIAVFIHPPGAYEKRGVIENVTPVVYPILRKLNTTSGSFNDIIHYIIYWNFDYKYLKCLYIYMYIHINFWYWYDGMIMTVMCTIILYQGQYRINFFILRDFTTKRKG